MQEEQNQQQTPEAAEEATPTAAATEAVSETPAAAAAPETEGESAKRGKKVRTGTVVSNKMDKSIVVQVQRRVRHKLYKKYVTKTKKFIAHDENNECNIGDVVRISETRPLSSRKRWRLEEIIERAV